MGLRNARLNFRQQEENHIMENIIFNELIAREFDVDVGMVEYFCWTKRRWICNVTVVMSKGTLFRSLNFAVSLPVNHKIVDFPVG